MKKSKRKWTPEEDELLLSGPGPKELARMLGTSSPVVVSRQRWLRYFKAEASAAVEPARDVFARPAWFVEDIHRLSTVGRAKI